MSYVSIKRGHRYVTLHFGGGIGYYSTDAGCPAQMPIDPALRCEICYGKGVLDCDACNGLGVAEDECFECGHIIEDAECSECEGDKTTECYECYGSGRNDDGYGCCERTTTYESMIRHLVGHHEWDLAEVMAWLDTETTKFIITGWNGPELTLTRDMTMPYYAVAH